MFLLYLKYSKPNSNDKLLKSEWVIEWLLFMPNYAAILRQEQVTLDQMMFTLYKTNTLIWIFIALVHWNNSLRADMLLHLDILSSFRANQSLLLLYNAACLTEKQQIPILKSLVWTDWGSNPWSITLEASMLNAHDGQRKRYSLGGVTMAQNYLNPKMHF